MKKYLTLVAALAMLATACQSNKSQETTVEEEQAESTEIAFEVAQNYFFRNDQEIPETPKITTAEEFETYFGMAATMSPDGKPTAIDFDKQFVVPFVMPATDIDTEITPVKVEKDGDKLCCTFSIKQGEQQSFTIQPLSIIIIDKAYEDLDVELCAVL